MFHGQPLSCQGPSPSLAVATCTGRGNIAILHRLAIAYCSLVAILILDVSGGSLYFGSMLYAVPHVVLWVKRKKSVYHIKLL